MILLDLFSKFRLRKTKIIDCDRALSNHSKLVLKNHPSLKITAKDNTVVNIVLTLTGKNLFNGEYDKGYLKHGDKNIFDINSNSHRTTKWFPILASQGHSLVLSGTAHNRSIWQFKTTDGTILTKEGVLQKYNVVSDVMQNRTVSKVNIPEFAAYARVYYVCIEDSTLDNRLQIEYGKVPTHYQPYHSVEIDLAQMNKGDYITYDKGIWTLNKNEREENLLLSTPDIEVGNTISLNTDNCHFDVLYDEVGKDVIYTGIYGVRWNLKDSNPICERVGDAKGLTFNAIHNSICLTPYENSFDKIYPWSDMKVCSIKVTKNGKRKKIYSNEEDFRLDGSTGNIMVEIPKFYCKRELIDDYEYLWISATEQDGFTLDPSFVTAGGIVNHIYIGAYLSKISKKKLVSVSNSFPLINKSLKDLQEYVLNSNGVMECDLLAILTIQRLFLVETAILDSQSIFEGNVHLPYLLKDKSTSYYAVSSEKSTNRIIVKDTNLTRRFCIGDAVSILNNWKMFKNIPMVYQREIINIKNIGKEKLEIEFSGDAIDIMKQETGITCIPCKNGTTDQLPYVSGSIGNLNGHSSFKYRGVENLWGNVSILLENAFVKDSELYINYPTGNVIKVGYKVPVQKVELFPAKFGDPANMIVKRMGFDRNNPLIMFPEEIGKGAKTSSYYCDAWYNLAEEGITYILTYGGAWDNKGYAGIFNFRASFTDTKKMPYNGSRIMLR